MSLSSGIALLDLAILRTGGSLRIAVVHCRKGREEKLGRGPRTVERFLLHMTILWCYRGYTLAWTYTLVMFETQMGVLLSRQDRKEVFLI